MKDIALFLGPILLRALFCAPLVFLFWWLRRAARNYHPKEDSGALEFTVVPAMKVLLIAVIVALLAFTVFVCAWIISSAETGSWYALLIPLSVLAAILLAIPRPVQLNQHGLRQRFWIKQDREIAWPDVASVERGTNTGTTYVKSANGGRPISFSPLLVSQSRFEHEVRARVRQWDNVEGG